MIIAGKIDNLKTMGVQGLFQLLKPVQKDCNIRDNEGQTAAVDVMTWLYKGAYSCATELGLG